MRRACAAIALLALGLGSSAVGAGDPERKISLGGGYKNLLFYTEDSRQEEIATDLNRLRLELRGGARRVNWRLVHDLELFVGGLVESPDFAVIESIRDRTYLDLETTVHQTGNRAWLSRLHRAHVRWEGRNSHVILGRQRIAWGSGRLWNPTDFFNPVDPTAVEPGEKTGVDSILVAFERGPFGALQFVGAPGRPERGVAGKGVVRWRDTVGATDYAVLVGYIDDDTEGGLPTSPRMDESFVAGLDLTGNLRRGGLRFESLHVRPGDGGAYTQAILGYDYRVAGSELDLLAEYFYNDNVGAFDPGQPSISLRSRSKHLIGLSAGKDLTPLLRFQGLLLVDLAENSRFFSPTLSWSATSSTDLTLAVQLYGGRSGSQYGDGNDLYLVQMEIAF